MQPIAHSLKKKSGPKSPKEPQAAPRTGYSGVGEFTSPFFFPWPPLKLKRLRFGLGSSGFHSQMVCDHLVHQCQRCKSAESRINLLLGTSPRHCDVDETRDWSRQSKFENDQFSNWRGQYRKSFFFAQEAN